MKKTQIIKLLDALPHDVLMEWLLVAIAAKDPEYITSLLN